MKTCTCIGIEGEFLNLFSNSNMLKKKNLKAYYARLKAMQMSMGSYQSEQTFQEARCFTNNSWYSHTTPK